MSAAAPVLLVTGGGSGIGAAVARRAAREGWKVAVMGRRRRPLEAVAGEVGGIALVGDVGEEADAQRCVAEAVAACGRLDAVVLNAGSFHGGAVGTLSLATWEAELRTNLTGVFLVARAALPHLLDARGAVVTVASLAALRAGSDDAAYAAAKAGAVALTRSLAVDYGPRGLRANCVCPAWTRTEMADAELAAAAALIGTDLDGAYAAATAMVPLRRAAAADEIAALVTWLASPAASYLNGATIPVDGGLAALDPAATRAAPAAPAAPAARPPT